MFKKVLFVAFSMIMLFSFMSCHEIHYRIFHRDQYVAENTAKKLCSAIQKKEPDKLLNLFSNTVIEATPDLKTQIADFFDWLGTDFEITKTVSNASSVSIKNYQRYVSGGGGITINKDHCEYKISFGIQIEDTEKPDNKGVEYMEIYPSELKALAHYIYPFTGIKFVSTDDSWYDEKGMFKGTNVIEIADNGNIESVSALYPVIFFEDGGSLFPLFSVLNAIDAEYLWDKENETIDIRHNGRHLQLTFQPSNTEHFKWIALTDMDNSRHLRLSNTPYYDGLYTNIDGNLYLESESAGYLLHYLGLSKLSRNRTIRILK